VIFDGIVTDIPRSFCDAIRDMGEDVGLKRIKKVILDTKRTGERKGLDCKMMLTVLEDMMWELGVDNPE